METSASQDQRVLGLSPEVWLLIAALLSIVHHADHVLRFDHSGWPFIDDVTTFTYSLAVYPVVGLVFVLRGWLRMVAVLTFFLALAPTLAHSLIETPFTQYDTWANHPEVNLLGVASPFLGFLAGIVTVSLSIAATCAFLGFAKRALRLIDA